MVVVIAPPGHSRLGIVNLLNHVIYLPIQVLTASSFVGIESVALTSNGYTAWVKPTQADWKFHALVGR